MSLTDAELTYLELNAKGGDLPTAVAKDVLQLVAEVREVRDNPAMTLAQDALAKVEDLEFDLEFVKSELDSVRRKLEKWEHENG